MKEHINYFIWFEGGVTYIGELNDNRISKVMFVQNLQYGIYEDENGKTVRTSPNDPKAVRFSYESMLNPVLFTNYVGEDFSFELPEKMNFLHTTISAPKDAEKDEANAMILQHQAVSKSL